MVCKDWDIALTEKNKQITAVFPYSIEKKLGLKILRNPPLTPFLGPYILEGNDLSYFKRLNREEQIFEELWQQLPAYDSFDILSTTNFDNFLLFQHKGFTSQCRITYHIELSQSEDQIFKNIQSSHRKRIEQATDLYTVEEGTKYIPNLIQLHEETFKRKGKDYHYSPTLIQQVIETCYAQQAGKLLVAKDADGNVMGSIFVAWDNDKAYLLLSAVDAAQAHKGTICLLIWKAILAAKNQGLKIFDFEGSIDPGIEPFFRRFGGERKNFFHFTDNKSKVWKLKKTLLG